MAHKKMTRKKVLNILGCVLLILAVVLFCLALLFQDPAFLEHYDDLMQWLENFEYAVATIPYKELAAVVILLIFVAKAVGAPLPISAVCLISGMAFSTPIAILLNTAGILVLFIIKFYWGKHIGGGLVHRFLVRNDDVRRILDNADARAKGGLLFAFRLVPSFPLNTISQLYGAMQYDIKPYLLLSLLGFMPKLISYSIIGRNVYNPFSMAFMMPIVILLTISGLSLFGINKLISFYNSLIKNKDSNAKSAGKDVSENA